MNFRNHISIKDLNVWYNSQQALNNINIDIPDKGITAIIGPSGCGKSTLLKSLNRLIEIQDDVKVTGQVLIDGEDIYSTRGDITLLRKKVGLLFQRPQPLPMSIYDNVAYGPRIHGIKNRDKLNKIVEKYLKLGGLWEEVKDRLQTPASALSIGQQQRLCLARSLAVEPEIILGDEPTSALDPISAEHIERRFLELKKQYTIVLVTHIMRQARRLADYVMFVYFGSLIEHGPADEFFKNPKDARTEAYINGLFIEDYEIEKELNLKGGVSPANLFKTKLAMDKIGTGKVLKIIVDDEPAMTELSKAMKFEGNKVLDVKRVNNTDWEIIVQRY